jgi:RNA polymerase sigma-B factor
MNGCDYAARNALVESHRHLCRRVALRFHRRGLDLRDLEQVAAIGLIKASDRYDPSSRAPFEAYARVMILGELMHHVRDFEHAVRLPRWLRRLERRYSAMEEALTTSFERAPTQGEIAAAMGVTLNRIAELNRARNAVLAYAGEARDGAPDELPSTLSLWACGARHEDRMLAESALRALQPLERTIILGVYALGLTQAQVARQLQLGPRQVYRMHRAALARMQCALAKPPARAKSGAG